MLFEKNKTIAFRPTDENLERLNQLAVKLNSDNKSFVMNEALAASEASVEPQANANHLNEVLAERENEIAALELEIKWLKEQVNALNRLLEEEKNKVPALPSVDVILEQIGLSKENFNELISSANQESLPAPPELKPNECIVAFEKEELAEVVKLRGRLIKLGLANEADEPQTILKAGAQMANDNIDAFLTLLQTFKPLI